jgi:phenylalanine-4-hydroxylase
VNSFDLISHVPSSTTIKAKHTAERDDLEVLYQTVRSIRESNDSKTSLEPIFAKIQENHPKDWLLAIEIIELLNTRNESNLMQQVLLHLENLKKQRPEIEKLISNGLELIFENEETTH